jgi:7,8-dihydroneopterin aldolase/epimerase/oxygenase
VTRSGLIFLLSCLNLAGITIFGKNTGIMGLIQIENMEFYAYHGCYKQEQVVGNRFLVDLEISANLDKATLSDNIEDTLNYQNAYDIVKEQMSINSRLLEHVAGRILDELLSRFTDIEKATVRVSKMNPPMGGQIDRVSVTLSRPG